MATAAVTQAGTGPCAGARLDAFRKVRDLARFVQVSWLHAVSLRVRRGFALSPLDLVGDSARRITFHAMARRLPEASKGCEEHANFRRPFFFPEVDRNLIFEVDRNLIGPTELVCMES